MSPGDIVAVFVQDGRVVVRWKEQRAQLGNAVVAGSPEEMRNTLSEKFELSPWKLSDIAIFQFVGWADEDQPARDRRKLMPPPIEAFASVLSKQEIAERFDGVKTQVEQSDDPGPFWVELFVRTKTKADSGPADRQRFKRNSGRRRRGFRRD